MLLDEVIILKKALSEQEIKEIYDLSVKQMKKWFDKIFLTETKTVPNILRDGLSFSWNKLWKYGNRGNFKSPAKFGWKNIVDE